MNKKIIIFSIVGVVLIAAASVATLLLVRRPVAAPAPAVAAYNPSGPASKTVVYAADTSKDFGACKLIPKQTIKDTLGVPATELQGPDDLGLIHIKGGDDSQLCVYAFVSGGTFKNNFNSENSFTVEVYQHVDQASLDATKSTKLGGVASTPIAGIGDKAEFVSVTDTSLKRQQSILRVFSKLKHYKYTITQPTTTITVTPKVAQANLTTLATSVSYK